VVALIGRLWFMFRLPIGPTLPRDALQYTDAMIRNARGEEDYDTRFSSRAQQQQHLFCVALRQFSRQISCDVVALRQFSRQISCDVRAEWTLNILSLVSKSTN